MLNQADIELSMENALAAYCNDRKNDSIPTNLADRIRFSLHSPQRRIGARFLLACAEMVGLSNEAALPAAVALEFVNCSVLLRRDPEKKSESRKDIIEMSQLTGVALLSIALEVFSESSAHVSVSFFIQAQKRLAASLGAKGTAGGEAREMLLTSESSLDQLRQMQAQKTGTLFSMALLIPKDFVGIADDSPEGLALEIFARELGLASQTLEDLDRKPSDPSSSNIRFFLQDQDARDMTLQRLTSAALSIESLWGAKAKTLLMIANEIRVKVGTTSDE
jgi:geranylgeranyl pyrophosphate synthase